MTGDDLQGQEVVRRRKGARGGDITVLLLPLSLSTTEVCAFLPMVRVHGGSCGLYPVRP